MIKSCEIEFYQSHKNTQIEFSPGLNTIIGSSDNGKSSILRAKLWVIMNKPMGDEFHSWFSNKKDVTRVAIEFDDCWIEKKRVNNSNVYITSESEGRAIEAMGRDLPSEISSLTRMIDHNIQTQKNPYFLLQDTAGEVARKLNQLVGLDIIDTLYKNLNSRISKTTSQIETNKIETESLENNIEKLSFIDSLDKELLELEKNQEKLDQNENKINIGYALLISFRSITSSQEKHKRLKEAGKEVDEIERSVTLYKENNKKITKIGSFLTDLSTITKSIETNKEWLQIEKEYIEIREHTEKYKREKEKIVRLNSILDQYKKCIKKINEWDVYLTNQTFKYRSLLKQRPKCPICSSPLTAKFIEEILL